MTIASELKNNVRSTARRASYKPPALHAHCHEIIISNSGDVMHRKNGEQPCLNCLTSSNLYQQYNRLMKGESVRLTREDLFNLILAYDRTTRTPNVAFDKAVRAMFAGLGRRTNHEVN